MRFCAFLFILLIALPTAARAETKEFSVTDVAQIAGEWEGSFVVKSSSTTVTNVLLVIKANGTWESPTASTCGTFFLEDGKIRSQLLVQGSTPIPLSRSSIATWTFFENEGKLSFKTERDDLSVTGQYTRKLGPGLGEPQADTLDPRLLIGEWQGTIAYNPQPAYFTSYFLTISRVVGRQVSGRMQWLASGNITAQNFGFTGTVDGQVLTIRDPGAFYELTIFDRRMKGWAHMGSVRWLIDVRKAGSVSSPVGCK